MQETTNYRLKKIELTDAPPDITELNGNFDIIDAQLQTLSDNKVNKSGGTMTGALTLSGAPTANLHAATKKYVDDGLAGKAAANHSHNNYLLLSGGTMTGALTLSGAPTANLHAATKKYVDDGLAGKVGKASSHTTGNFMSFDSGGNAADSGKKASDFANASHTHTASEIASGTLTVVRGGTGKASVGDTNYTSYNYRGASLNDTTTNPTTNGTIAWKYQ